MPRSNKLAASVPGVRYGRLVTTGAISVHKLRTSRHKKFYWECFCDCGERYDAPARGLLEGITVQCFKCCRNAVGKKLIRHGGYGKRWYTIWKGMIQRCCNPNNKAYKYYGGRGITVCAAWEVPDNFLADMGEPPDGYTLERVDNNQGYFPGNCKWASRKEQSNNTRTTRHVTLNNKTQSITAWCEELGLNYSTICVRIHRGMSAKEALTTPVVTTKED